jgi:hypothetical protein
LIQNYNNSNVQIQPVHFFRARGNATSPQTVQAGDDVLEISAYAYANGTPVLIAGYTTDVKNISGNTIDTLTVFNGPPGNVSTWGNSEFRIEYGHANIANGAVQMNSDGNITATGRLDYLRTFGSFTSNATQTSAGANTVNYMTLNNTEDANGVSIVSNSQITVARTGRYNLQFSAQVQHDTNQTANVEIWLTKNGNAVANTNTVLTVVKDQKAVAAWNFLDNVSSANTYYQIAWASPDTNVELVAVDSANTIANVAIPSVILTVTPVGA